MFSDSKSPFKFDIPREQSQIIKVIGVGGGGSNAVNHMYNQGIKGVDFLVCNTDSQALDVSPIPSKIQLGASLTSGRGAGSIPEVGRNAAIENIDDVMTVLENNTVMLFVTAGMGGGTGTGAAPVIAKKAREMGILTVGIVTMPFTFEGKRRKEQAEAGIRSMREAVDTLLIIRNERLREIYGNLSVKNAFAKADDILTTAAKGIAELISVTGFVNVDMNDVISVMKDSGVAILGQASAEGDDRAIKAVRAALESPLLNDNDIRGAKNILLNITYGEEEVMMDEIGEITDYVQEAAGATADVIFGYGFDDSLGKELSVTVIATGFDSKVDTGIKGDLEQKNTYIPLSNAPAAPEGREVGTRLTNPWQVTEDKKEEPSVQEPFLKRAEETPAEPIRDKEEEEFSGFTSYSNEHPNELDFEEPFIKPRETRVENENNLHSGQETKKVYMLEEDDFKQRPETPAMKSRTLEPEDMQRKAAERISKVRELNRRLQSPGGISDLENEPAYRRRNVEFENLPHSSESQVSRYTLSEEEDQDGERKVELRPNNPFLHDNVD